MDEGKTVMASAIRPLKRLKRSKFKKNYLSSNERWGQVVVKHKEKTGDAKN
jgi:hypothetical protein